MALLRAGEGVARPLRRVNGGAEPSTRQEVEMKKWRLKRFQVLAALPPGRLAQHVHAASERMEGVSLCTLFIETPSW